MWEAARFDVIYCYAYALTPLASNRAKTKQASKAFFVPMVGVFAATHSIELSFCYARILSHKAKMPHARHNILRK